MSVPGGNPGTGGKPGTGYPGIIGGMTGMPGIIGGIPIGGIPIGATDAGVSFLVFFDGPPSIKVIFSF